MAPPGAALDRGIPVSLDDSADAFEVGPRSANKIERLQRNGIGCGHRRTMRRNKGRDMLGTAGLIGQSTAVQSVCALLDRIANTDTPLLVVGEPGTYREAFAEVVHARGPRRGAPLLGVDGVGGDSDRLELELFGDERD